MFSARSRREPSVDVPGGSRAWQKRLDMTRKLLFCVWLHPRMPYACGVAWCWGVAKACGSHLPILVGEDHTCHTWAGASSTERSIGSRPALHTNTKNECNMNSMNGAKQICSSLQHIGAQTWQGRRRDIDSDEEEEVDMGTEIWYWWTLFVKIVRLHALIEICQQSRLNVNRHNHISQP